MSIDRDWPPRRQYRNGMAGFRHPQIEVAVPGSVDTIPVDAELAPIIALLWHHRIVTNLCCQHSAEAGYGSPEGCALISFKTAEGWRAFVNLVVAGRGERRAIVAGWHRKGFFWNLWVFVPRGQLPELERWLETEPG